MQPFPLRAVFSAGLYFFIVYILGSVVASERQGLSHTENGSAASVSVVSAASFSGTLAPDSIASAFGERLATQTVVATDDADPNTPGIQLPTQLAGTTVEINGQRAGLFFVSPGQINFALPAAVAVGEPVITIRSGDGTVSTGNIKVDLVAPAIFTANANGSGVPAAVLLRVAADGMRSFEPVAQYDSTTKTFVSRQISWTASGERLYLILYLSGIQGAVDADRNGNVNETIHVLLGGQEIVPDYAGKAPGFAGLDQLNVELPRNLSGRGTVDLAVSFSTQALSNVTRVEIGGAGSSLNVANFSPATALVGEEITINGAGFIANANLDQAFFPDASGQRTLRGKLSAAGAGQLKAVVPFGAGSGRITVRSSQNEAVSAGQLTIRTSISGFVETTRDKPLAGVRVQLLDGSISSVTDGEGKFILRDVPAGNRVEYKIDPSSLSQTLPFPPFRGSVRVEAGRDHHLDRISLQQATGPAITFGASGTLTDERAEPVSSPSAPTKSIEIGGVTFEIDNAATAIFPNGETRGDVVLTLVENSRLPVKLPTGVFSSTIIQLTPFGTRLSPGGKLTFPNMDNLASNSPVKLYRLDQTSGSAKLGQFVEAGAAQISPDGKMITTTANAITETSYYFVAAPRPVTTLLGRVVDSDGVTPVGGALVRSRGQSMTTDSLGEFLLRNLPINETSDPLTVEASYQRPGGRVDLVQRNGIAGNPGGITRIKPDLVLPSPQTLANRPPVLVAPLSLQAVEGTTLDTEFYVSDPDAGQALQVTVTGAVFASIIQVNGSTYILRLTQGANTAGNYSLLLSVTDSSGERDVRGIELTVYPRGWATIAFMPTHRIYMSTGIINDLLYVVGGLRGPTSNSNSYLNSLEVYDPVIGGWTERAPMPTPRIGAMSAVIGGKLYVVGGGMNTGNGQQITNVLEVYDPVTNSWSTKSSPSTARFLAGSAIIDGKWYVAGGIQLLNNNFQRSNILEVYNPLTDTWEKKQSMLGARGYCAAVALGGRLFVIGGDDGVSPTNTLQVYDPATNSWALQASVPTPRVAPAVGVIDGRIYVAGGVPSNTGPAETTAHESYDPILNQWRVEDAMPTARWGAGGAVIRRRFFVLGGGTGRNDGVPLAIMEAFRP